MGTQSNAQREVQLLAEWATTLPKSWQQKTHVAVGKTTLQFNGELLARNLQRALLVWSDWADMRIFTGSEVWLVEAKLVNLSQAYGQVMYYCEEYAASDDYQLFFGRPIIPIVLAASEKPGVREYFGRFGVRTIIYSPVWAERSIQVKIVGSHEDL